MTLDWYSNALPTEPSSHSISAISDFLRSPPPRVYPVRIRQNSSESVRIRQNPSKSVTIRQKSVTIRQNPSQSVTIRHNPSQIVTTILVSTSLECLVVPGIMVCVLLYVCVWLSVSLCLWMWVCVCNSFVNFDQEAQSVVSVFSSEIKPHVNLNQTFQKIVTNEPIRTQTFQYFVTNTPTKSH